MDEDLDLDAFIASMEQLAPKEELEDQQLRCQNCDTVLEMDDEGYVCPGCSARATNIMQLEETEIQYAEGGRVIGGQRVLTKKEKKPLNIDYGWAWSTDEAIVHILDSQVEHLEKLNIVPPKLFRQAVANMYLKFWHENVAIYIKDSYTDEELIPINRSKTLRQRDIEVLVYSKNKIMVPEVPVKKDVQSTRVAGVKFYRNRPRWMSSAISSSSSDSSPPSSDSEVSFNQPDQDIDKMEHGEELDIENRSNLDSANKSPHWTLNRETASILTLNRTLAFLLASGYLLNLDDPLTAADLVRAVSHRLIPFFGAHKTLPEGMKLNRKDMKLFMKNKPPNPYQLSRAASLLVHKTFGDKLPIRLARPNLGKFLERFIIDTNLPHELIDFLDPKINFPYIRETRATTFQNSKSTGSFPLYERWAFSILICNLKRLFILNDKSLSEQKDAALNEPCGKLSENFILSHWMLQISMRLKLIMSYDPYVLFHPMSILEDLQPTPQVYNYIDVITEDSKVPVDIRKHSIEKHYSQENREMLAEFLKREFPRPKNLKCRWPDEDHLEEATDIKYPMRDALERTKRFWLPSLEDLDQPVLDIFFKDFSSDKIILPETSTTTRMWSICDGSLRNMKFEISPDWPYCFKLLLCLGGYLCFCAPKDLLKEYRGVEEFVFPELYTRKRKPSIL